MHNELSLTLTVVKPYINSENSLNSDTYSIENSVDPDQLASEKSWLIKIHTVFHIQVHYHNNQNMKYKTVFTLFILVPGKYIELSNFS